MSSLSDELYVSLLLLLVDRAFPAADLVPLAKADALRFLDPATGAVQHGRSTLQTPIYLPPKASQVRTTQNTLCIEGSMQAGMPLIVERVKTSSCLFLAPAMNVTALLLSSLWGFTSNT